MQWIKTRFDQFLLLLLAVVLLASSGLLIVWARAFPETFAGSRGEPPKNTTIEAPDIGPLTKAEELLASPSKWKIEHAGSLFVAKKHILKDGILVAPEDDESMPLHPPVENKWLSKNDLDLYEEDILTQDPDSDGFTNFDEWQGKTDPNNKEEHPGYWTKLRLKQFKKVRFRLKFAAYEGNPADPGTLTFQINTLDVNQPTQFLKLNDKIAGTKFQIVDFEYKKMMTPNNVEEDISELTVENNETKQRVVLILEKIIDSPDSYAVFKYLWNGEEFQVKKDKNFKLKPDGTEYKVVEITEANAVIQDAQTGDKHTIPKLE